MAAINAANLIGSQRTRTISEYFGTAENAWYADDEEFEDMDISQSALKSFLEFRKTNPDTPAMLEEYLAKRDFDLCCLTDEDYPPILKEIPIPPAVLYYRGELKTFAERIAMVGTRENTDYGRRVALEISEELSRAGLTVVSGAARGIDKFSHIGAMKSGRTVAVLGGGINFYYKHDDKKLLDEIAENGLVVSEFNPNLPPNKGTFPARNRVVAGLSRCVIVVEAGEESGALLTADEAKKINRDVFAVPGNISSKKSFGCHDLIWNGDAILFRRVEDIFEKYNFKYEKVFEEKSAEKFLERPVKKFIEKKISVPELEGVEKKIFDIIPADDYITLDEILNQVEEVDYSEISQIMIQLESKKCVVEENQRYKRK